MRLRDVDRDGRLDVLAACFDGQSVSVLRGKGDGTLLPRTDVSAGSPLSVDAADFDGDGKPDLVSDTTAFAVITNRGNGDGTFQPLGIQNGTIETDVVTADFNGDGRADVGGAGFVLGGLDVYLGFGDGTFESVRSFGLRNNNDQQDALVAGDFNGDGLADAAVTDRKFGHVVVYVNTTPH